MKRIVIILFLMTLLDVKSQGVQDRNWDTENPVFYDSFNASGRLWDTLFESIPDRKWRAYFHEGSYGVTSRTSLHVYQPEYAVFDSENGVIRFTSEYAGHQIMCGEYALPPHKICDTSSSSHFFYYTAAMETRRKFGFGYFEIRCKLPIHRGAYPAFWLYGTGVNEDSYEEIDIFEYSYSFFKPGNTQDQIGRRYTMGIWYNPNEVCFDFSGDSLDSKYRGRLYPQIPINHPRLDEWNVISCEWAPSYVRWFLNGELVNGVWRDALIPQNKMWLKLNYSIDSTAMSEGVVYQPQDDEMVTDYIRVLKLKTDCDAEEDIYNLEELENFEYSVKKYIRFWGGARPLVFPNDFNDTFRATDGISLTGSMVVPLGAQVSFAISYCDG